MRKSRLRQTAIRFAAGGAFALLAWLSLEALLHAGFFAQRGYWLFSGRDGLRVPYAKPVADRRQYALRENAVSGLYAINGEGFRGPNFRADDNRPVLCVLGDSAPFGIGVADDQTFPAHLQQILDQRGFRYRVLNAGVPSYNLRQSVDRWEFDVRPRYSCAAIVLNAANDVSLIDHYREKWTPDVTWADVRFGIDGPERSAVLHFAKAAIVAFSARAAPNGAYPVHALETLRATFSAALDRIAASGIPVLLLPVNPCYYGDQPIRDPANSEPCKNYRDYVQTGEDWDDLIRRVNALLRRTAEEKKVGYLDAVALLDRAGRTGKFVDFIHFSDAGNREIAVAIADALEQGRLIAR